MPSRFHFPSFLCRSCPVHAADSRQGIVVYMHNAVDTSDMSRVIASHHLHLHFINYSENVIILQTGERTPNHWSLAMQKGAHELSAFGILGPLPTRAARRPNGNCS